MNHSIEKNHITEGIINAWQWIAQKEFIIHHACTVMIELADLDESQRKTRIHDFHCAESVMDEMNSLIATIDNNSFVAPSHLKDQEGRVILIAIPKNGHQINKNMRVFIDDMPELDLFTFKKLIVVNPDKELPEEIIEDMGHCKYSFVKGMKTPELMKLVIHISEEYWVNTNKNTESIIALVKLATGRGSDDYLIDNLEVRVEKDNSHAHLPSIVDLKHELLMGNTSIQ